MTSNSGDGNDPSAWLGLLKWSLAHQDGTEPSDARPMTDQDRAWLEKVVTEGVRDDVKAMTDIYVRLCSYLDDLAPNTINTATATSRTTSLGGSSDPLLLLGPSSDQSEVANDQSLAASDQSQQEQSSTAPASGATLSTPSAVTSAGVGAGFPADTRAEACAEGVVPGGEERLEGVMNDLEELQDIVEQIDMAETFAKIGGFGRLIALAAPAYRPEKLRRRAASVIATLTKNNPPAQAAFSSSGGQRALLEAVAAENASSTEGGDGTELSPAVRLAFLHALSCSVMGSFASEDALCSEVKFQEFLAGALSQTGREGSGAEADEAAVTMGARLRSKAAFVLKALIGAPGASSSRTDASWPALTGLLTGLEALSQAGPGDDPAAARETCIEALLAAARGVGGERVVSDLGPRVSAVMASRREILVGGGHPGSVPSLEGRSQEDQESAAIELSLWMDWERLSGPAQ